MNKSILDIAPAIRAQANVSVPRRRNVSENSTEEVAIARPPSTIARALTHSSLYESATLIKLCRGIALRPRVLRDKPSEAAPRRLVVTPQNCAQAFPDYRDSRLLPDAGGKTARAVPASFCFPSFLRFMARTATIAGTAICLVPRGGKQAAHSLNSRRYDNQVCHALLHADAALYPSGLSESGGHCHVLQHAEASARTSEQTTAEPRTVTQPLAASNSPLCSLKSRNLPIRVDVNTDRRRYYTVPTIK